VYCVLCTVYCVLCTVYCVLCTVYCVLCTVYSCTVKMRPALNSFRRRTGLLSVLWTTQCTVDLSTVDCVRCTLQCILRTMHYVYCAQLSANTLLTFLPNLLMQFLAEHGVAHVQIGHAALCEHANNARQILVVLGL
jgi:hypothetical protein